MSEHARSDVEFGEQRPDATADFIADGTNLFDTEAGRVGRVPLEAAEADTLAASRPRLSAPSTPGHRLPGARLPRLLLSSS